MKVDEKIFWTKVFYVPPQTWEDLQEHCESNCTIGVPKFEHDICYSCKAMRDWLDAQRLPRRLYGIPQRP